MPECRIIKFVGPIRRPIRKPIRTAILGAEVYASLIRGSMSSVSVRERSSQAAQSFSLALTRAAPTRNRALPRAAISSSAHEGIPDTQSGAPKGSYVIRLESVDSDTVGIQVAVGVCPGKVCSGVLGPSSPGFSPEVF